MNFDRDRISKADAAFNDAGKYGDAGKHHDIDSGDFYICNPEVENCSAICGNSVVEPGETCDPIGDCPESCEDGNACSLDYTLGKAETCNVICKREFISECVNNDECCPEGCDYTRDTDCSSNCGNGVLEEGETCDPSSLCLNDCSDGNSCTVETMVGSAANCNVDCSYQLVTRCGLDDKCCPAGCNANNDEDCTTTCGNGFVEPGETCDPVSVCPTTCDDGTACTIDTKTGSAENCNAACNTQRITQCKDDDDCCPAGCDANKDDDCTTTCDNGIVEPEETCDPRDTCPQSCDDGAICTIDTITGSAENCNVACGHQTITECQRDDGCCPPGCDATNDNDCSASCGNGVVEPGETCDPPSACPSDCDDGTACTIDAIVGNRENCTAVCTHQNITQCRNGDGCCPAACNTNIDNDCSATCGNGAVESGETCDPPSTCPTLASCDDGNSCTIDSITGSAANCTAACAHQTITQCRNNDGCCPQGCNANNDNNCSPSCGNGTVEEGETCDPPATCPTTCNDGVACTIDTSTGSAANCNVACSHQTITQCGDGDACCPGGCNANNDDACSPSCNNGAVEDGETCDPPATCPTTCNDGVACTIDTSTGSAANCNVACSHQTITECGDGDACCPNGCNANNDDACSPSCNNGAVEDEETCDPPATCPTLAECTDENSCTIDSVTGSAQNCTAACAHQTITECSNGDSCCPAGCNANNDNDCSPSCNNGAVEDGETCDPPATCPTLAECTDENSCTIDSVTGSAQNCTADCAHQTITECGNGDSCCPAGCNANNDDTCSPICDNGVVEEGETCDPPETCPTICPGPTGCTTYSLIGNAEECTADCEPETVTDCQLNDGCCPDGCNTNSTNLDNDCPAVCGNGALEEDETCDPPETCPTTCLSPTGCTTYSLIGNAEECTADCEPETVTDCQLNDGCCPDGCNANSTNLDNDCPAVCGNGALEEGETCDPPADCETSESCTTTDPCFPATFSGDPDQCTAQCNETEITACSAETDGCCPENCTSDTDPDCLSN